MDGFGGHPDSTRKLRARFLLYSPAFSGEHRMARAMLVVAILLLGGCGYNALQSSDEQVKAAWSEVVNQYQRRADLIPNLVSTVQAYAKQERDIFTAVANARSRLSGAIQSGDPTQMADANQALNAPLGRLLAIVENYPQLKSSENFRGLSDELAGTENPVKSDRVTRHSESDFAALRLRCNAEIVRANSSL
jgi:LemA protein